MKSSRPSLVRFTLMVAGMSVLSALPAAADNSSDRFFGGRRPPRTFHAELDGAQEAPAISTMSTATFRATLNAAEDTLTYELSYSELEGGPGPTAAHIHIGQPGVAGGVMFFLCGGGPAPGTKPACPPAPATVTGTVVASDIAAVAAQGIAAGEFDEAIRAMRNGITYANIHDATWPGGEIRGAVISMH